MGRCPSVNNYLSLMFDIGIHIKEKSAGDANSESSAMEGRWERTGAKQSPEATTSLTGVFLSLSLVFNI